jgi:hypothetical protein
MSGLGLADGCPEWERWVSGMGIGKMGVRNGNAEWECPEVKTEKGPVKGGKNR